MRMIGRLLEATLAMTFLVGLLGALFNRTRRARFRRARPMSPGSHPGWNTFSSGYDETVLPPANAATRPGSAAAVGAGHDLE